MSDWKTEFKSLWEEDQATVRRCAQHFRVPLMSAYFRAKELGLIKPPAHQADPSPVANVAMLLQSKAETIRKEYQLAYGKPCDCGTTEGALHYGRAQGLEMAADIIAAASEGSTDE